MGFKMKASNAGGDFEPAPEGTHPAVCVRLIDLGTQQTNFGPKRRVQVGFEIDARRDDGKRFMAFGHYTHSFHEKAAFRQMLEGWRGRKFTDAEEFDVATILRKPCMVNLVRDGDYTNIRGVMGSPKGVETLEPEGDVIYVDLDDPNMDEIGKLSERMQEKLFATPEYRDATGQKPAAGQSTKVAPDMGNGTGMQVANGGADFDDEIPFARLSHEYAIS